MAERKPLRAVAPDERPTIPKSPKSVTEAADKGTTRELLVAMKTRIAKAVEDSSTPARDLAALSTRLMQITRDIEAIDAREGQEADDGPAEDEAFDATAI